MIVVHGEQPTTDNSLGRYFFKEARQVTVDVYNDTDTPEQLHWHGQHQPLTVFARHWPTLAPI